jgi:hypothetical protein
MGSAPMAALVFLLAFGVTFGGRRMILGDDDAPSTWFVMRSRRPG